MRNMVPATVVTMQTYDREAEVYAAETSTYEVFPGLDAEVRMFHTLAPSGAVVDAGCGVGRDALYLSSLGRPVIAMDISQQMLKSAQTRADSKVRLIRADITAFPLADRCVAGVWMCASLLHLPREAHPVALLEAYRVLTSRGVLSISMKAGDRDELVSEGRIRGQRWLSEVDPLAFANLLRELGFVNETVTESGRGTWFVASAVRP
jgi:ubiquinone/menaquinone biosynthesis C-methylase UbiE